MTTSTLARLAALALILVVAAGCDRPQPSATPTPPVTTAPAPGQQEAPAVDDHDHEHGEARATIHLGNEMYHIARRISAVWYAGKAGNAEMVDYQLHEIEEAAETIEEAQIVEHGVAVGPEFQKTVASRFEEMETAVKKGDMAAFEKLYTDTLAGCNACHARTDHGFIVIERPTRNPYPNLNLGGR